jgi:hypothetical protein
VSVSVSESESVCLCVEVAVMGSVIRFRVASGRQLRSMCMFKYQFVLLHRMCMCMMAGRKRKDAGVADRPGKGRHRDNCWFLLQLQKVCWCLLVFASVARSMMQAFARVCCILLHVLLIDGKSPSVLKGDFPSKFSKNQNKTTHRRVSMSREGLGLPAGFG